MTAVPAIVDQYVTLQGRRVHYREVGPVGAPTLLILHGGQAQARSWDAVAAALADCFHVVVPDLRGHGETAWAPDYAPDAFVEDTEQLARQLDLPRCALLGHSLGAAIAWRYAAHAPHRVERLVLVDIGPDGHTSPRLTAWHAALRAAATEALADPEEAIQRALGADPQADAAAVRARTGANLVQGADGRWPWRYDAARLGAALPFGAAVEAHGWSLLAQIRCPTLVVRGADSPVLSRATAERMARTLPTGRWVEVPHAGHVVYVDNCSGFLTVVRPFVLERRSAEPERAR